MRAWTWAPRIMVAGLAVVWAAGCSSDGGVGGAITPAEKTALASALFDADALEGLGAAAGFAGFIFTQVDQVGSLSSSAQASVNRAIQASISGVRAASYEGAIGMQIVYTVTTSGESGTGTFTGILGWDGLNVTARTVDEAVSAGLATEGSTTPAGNGTYQLDGILSGGAYGLGTYFIRSSQSGYASTSGTLTLSAQSFGGTSSSCDASAGGITVDCSFTLGTMSGSFAFEADRVVGSGPATYTQSAISFSSLPAVKMTITITDQ